jgi:D-sedoheptulose 7-phosphate isomerase
MNDARAYFQALSRTIGDLPFASIEKVAARLMAAYDNSRTIYTFGNGGSASLASHFACDLGKGTVNGSHKRFRVVALTDNIPLLTAWANDSRYDDIFAQQLRNLVREGDIVFGISGSGNSPNILNALQVGREARATTLGLTGYRGGRLKALCDECVIVPSDNMQIIEDLHLSVAHALFTVIRRSLCDRGESVAAVSSVSR